MLLYQVSLYSYPLIQALNYMFVCALVHLAYGIINFVTKVAFTLKILPYHYIPCREVLSNLLTEDQLLDESFSFSPLGFPSNRDSPASLLSENKSDVTNQSDPLSIVLNVPSAFGIKATQDKVTYINKGERERREGEREREREREREMGGVY